MKLKNVYKHIKTVCTHKYYVGKMCFKFGLYKQGILHDMSKFSLAELIPSIQYYKGTSSPIEEEKRQKGYSDAWMHHFHRNKHHWQYWIDYDMKQNKVLYKIPYKYALESVADWIGANITYSKNAGKEFEVENLFNYYRTKIRLNSTEIWHSKTKEFYDTIIVDILEDGLNQVIVKIKLGVYEELYKGYTITEQE